MLQDPEKFSSWFLLYLMMIIPGLNILVPILVGFVFDSHQIFKAWARGIIVLWVLAIFTVIFLGGITWLAFLSIDQNII